MAHSGFGRDDFDPGAVYAAFGAPFGLLAAPDVRHRYVITFFSDSSPSGTPVPDAGPVVPVRVTVRHDLAGGAAVDVSTRRAHGADVDLLEHMWWSVVEHRLAVPPDGVDIDGLREWAAEISLREPPPEGAAAAWQIDGAPTPCRTLVDDDLVVHGSTVEDGLVAVVSPTSADGSAGPAASVRLWRPAST